MEFKKQGHCVYYAKYHLVFVSKYRHKIFNRGVIEYLKDIIKRIQDHYPDIQVEELNGEQDHIHLFVSIPPKISVSRTVNIIKVNTAVALRKRFRYLDQLYWGQAGVWSDGYFVSTAGINEETIKKYIEQQWKEDRGQAKLELG